MRITIYCPGVDNAEAAIEGFLPGGEYSCEVSDYDASGDPWSKPEHALERIFRLFNRVDDADCRRLDGAGYKLPSLSMGDVVTMEGQHWLCAGVGWKRISADALRTIKKNPGEAYLYALRVGRS